MWKMPLAKSRAWRRRQEKERKRKEREQGGEEEGEEEGDLSESEDEGIAADDTDLDEEQEEGDARENSEEADRNLEYLVARQAELKENTIDLNKGAEETVEKENHSKRPRLMTINSASESTSSDEDVELEEDSEERPQKKLKKRRSRSDNANDSESEQGSSTTADVNANRPKEHQRGSSKGTVTIDGVEVTAVQDKLGRPHVAYGHSGKAYVFYHSRTSSIALHLSNIDSIIASLSPEDRAKMKVLVLSADDGYDWSLKVNITDHLLGLIWKRYDLDCVIMVKNAPNDSRWNEIERFWSYLTLRHKGLIIPERLPEMDENRNEDEAKDYVINEGIKMLVNTDKGNEWDGHKVTPVGLFQGAEEVEIDGVKLPNNAISEELYEHRKKLIESTNTFDTISRLDPEFAKDCKMFNQHYDRRCHFFMVCLALFKTN